VATLREAGLRHARCYLAVLQAADRRFVHGGDGVQAIVAWLDQEWTNIVLAQRWVQARMPHEEDAARLCSRFADAGRQVIAFRLTPLERVEWLHAARAGASRCGDRRAEIVHLGNLASAYTRLGQPERAIELLEMRMHLAQAAGDAEAENRAVGNLGAAYFALGDVQKAVELFERRVEISRAAGDRVSEGRMLGNLGAAYRRLRQFDRAQEYMQRNLDLSREIGDRLGEAQAIGNLAVLERNLGNPHRTIELLEDRIQAARGLGDRRGEAIALFNASLACRDLGETESARANAEAARLIFNEIGDVNADRVQRSLQEWGTDRSSRCDA
jgi:tetratricopeptide (TPR) repeat protein